MSIIAKWTGSYPTFCMGEWKLYIDNNDISFKIPEYLRHSNMETFGVYQTWFFNDQIETWMEYTDGLKCVDWIKKNEDWLNNITTDKNVQIEIYNAFQKEDFRVNYCGGCI